MGQTAIRGRSLNSSRICRAYGREPNDDLFSTWRAALGDMSVLELNEAFIAHQRNTTLDVRDGRPVGRWCPTPADLRAHVEAKHRSKSTQRANRGYCGQEDCLEGWIWVEPNNGDRRGVTRCPHCKALWEAGG